MDVGINKAGQEVRALRIHHLAGLALAKAHKNAVANGHGILPYKARKYVHHACVDNKHIRRFVSCGHVDTVFHGCLRPLGHAVRRTGHLRW